MSGPKESGVTREGITGARPDREARTLSDAPEGGSAKGAEHPRAEGRRRRPAERPTSYYGKPIINLPVWEEGNIAGYLFAGGLAGASSIIAAGGDLTGREVLARRSKLCASAALAFSIVALVRDLGRPGRFLHMLRVFKPTSPMSVGSWLLGVYGPLNATATATDVLRVTPAVGRLASIGAAGLGAGVASYTAALIADTAVPAWHEGHRELPFLFVGSAASAGAGFALLANPVAETAPARRIAVVGACGELLVEQLMERRLGIVSEALHDGLAGRRLRGAKALSVAGALGAATLARRSRLVAALSGTALLTGSALTRFGLFEAGMASARDPRYTVAPQRERLAAREAREAPGAGGTG